MSNRDPIWNDMKEAAKDKFDADRARFLAEAVAKDDGKWAKHTATHWSRIVAGTRLDYWPSRKKWMYKTKVQRGDVNAFMAKIEAKIVTQDRTRVITWCKLPEGYDHDECHAAVLLDIANSEANKGEVTE